jgi:hypothetical protein
MMTGEERELCRQMAARGEGVDALNEVLATWRDLGFNGLRTAYGAKHQEDFERDRAMLFKYLEEFHIVRAFLRPVPKTIHVKRHVSSYAWKHHAEDWSGTYISNGVFIAGALSMGFQAADAVAFPFASPNVYFNISKAFSRPEKYLRLTGGQAQ